MMDLAKALREVRVRAGAPAVSAYVKVVYRPEGDILTIDQRIGKYQAPLDRLFALKGAFSQ